MPRHQEKIKEGADRATRPDLLHRGLMSGLALAIFLCPPNGIGAQVQKRNKTAKVHITVVDGLGGELHGAEIKSFKNRNTGRDLAKSFHVDRFLWLTAIGIPYGHYDLILNQPGFPEAERPMDVFEPDLFVDVCVRTATVHLVTLLDPGRPDPLSVEVLSFKSREDGIDLAKRFKGDTATNIPYGIYDLRVFHHLGWGKRRVDVFQPEVWVLVGVEVYGELPEHVAPRDILTGTVQNLRSDEEPIYVRMIDVTVDFSIDDKVRVSGSSGTFTLTGFNPMGKFLLLTVGQSGILDVRQVDIPQKNPIVIDLVQKGNQREEQH